MLLEPLGPKCKFTWKNVGKVEAYKVGGVAYWSPNRDVAIFYRQDGPEIPDPGLIVMGKIDSGVEALNVPGSVKVTVEPVGKP